ncbi:hypothetical protein IPM62_02775 [Candidatus Woesebacteria bacterium]|nr:MAG: hypothetical protein IPM62_02775 [Candidatus Woesebacteria bacterium]
MININKILIVFLLFVFSIGGVHAQVSSDSAESNEIREKVQEKLEEAKNKAKAYIGTITDITDTTIQIKDAQGEIQQISSNDDAMYVKTNGSSSKISLDDVAIGDYIVAMGFKNGTSVLSASRILITSVEPDLMKVTVWGKISFNDDDNMEITDKDGNVFIVNPVKGAKYFLYQDNENQSVKYSEFDDNDTAIVMGEKEDDTIDASLIQIVNKGDVDESEKSE